MAFVGWTGSRPAEWAFFGAKVRWFNARSIKFWCGCQASVSYSAFCLRHQIMQPQKDYGHVEL